MKGSSKRCESTTWKMSPARMYSLARSTMAWNSDSGDVGGGLRQIGERIHHLAPFRQIAAEIGDHIGQTLAGLVIGGRAHLGRACGQTGGNDGHEILDIVEDRHDRRAQENGIGQTQRRGLVGRQPLHQPDHVIAHIAEEPGCHGRQARRQIDPGLGDQRTQRQQRIAGAGLEGPLVRRESAG